MAADTRERNARVALGLKRAPSGRRADLERVRRIVAGASDVAAGGRFTATEEAISIVSGDVSDLDAALLSASLGDLAQGPETDAARAELEDLIGEPTKGATAIPGVEAPEGYDVVIRSVPFRTSTIPLATPAFAAGREVARTIGPIRDASGRDIWLDILIRTRQVGLVRGVGAEPELLVPIKGLLKAGANFTLAAGSVWILARLLAPAAPANAYCGIRIKGGRLRLSAPATVAGGNLVIGIGTTMTLDIQTDPPTPTGAPGKPGADGDAARAEVPAKARFTFSPSGGQLATADPSSLSAFGTALGLTHRPGQGHVEPLINRVVLPFDPDAPAFKPKNVRSQLFSGDGEAPTIDGGWALPMTVAAPAALGAAAGSGGLLADLGPGIDTGWRGLAGGPISLTRTLILTEPGRVAIAAVRGSSPAAAHLLRLWNETGKPADASQVQLSFRPDELVRLFSEAGAVDAVVVASDLEATLDRPLSVDGRRVPLRSDSALVGLWQLASGFGALIVANVLPKASARPVGPIALTNALIHVSGPSILLIAGTWADPDQIAKGVAFVLFGVRRVIPSLRDPYATNLPAPFSRGRLDRVGAVTALLIAGTSWADPTSPKLALILVPVPGMSAIGAMAAAPSPAGQPAGIEPTDSQGGGLIAAFFDPGARIGEEDAAAEAGLRQEFERTAGNARESLVLVDVSSNIDQFGVGFGISRGEHGPSLVELPQVLPIAIDGLDLSTIARNLRVVLLPQFQWEPVVNIPNPLVGAFPETLASNDDGGPTVFGTNSVRLVPFAPERVTTSMLEEFGDGLPFAAKFTLPFGMKATARFQPFGQDVSKWASVKLNQPATADSRLVGGLQVAAYALPDSEPAEESPSFPGATWQTRNGRHPSVPWPLSVLAATATNPGVEKEFNEEMGPNGTLPRVPVTRIDFSGYGGSMYSSWANPNALATTSQVRFDVVVGRTAYEVVQVASILYPWAVRVVRTITLERRKEGAVFRFDSGWVAKSPGLYDYPDPDTANFPLPAEWTEIKTHPGVINGAYNVRRIRETGRMVSRTFNVPSSPTPIDVGLLEVRFDADFDIEGVVQGGGSGGLVTGRDQVGFVQSRPDGYTLLPEHLASIMDDEGPFGGAIDCVIDIGASGQSFIVKRIDVAPAPQPTAGPPAFAATARGAVALPADGQWSTARHDLSAAEPEPVNAQSGIPLIRKGAAPGGPGPADWYRIAEPADLLRENTPAVEFGLVQGADAHKVFFPRPRIKEGDTRWSSTEKPVLADPYVLSTGVGAFPPRAQGLVGTDPWGLNIGGDGRFTLLPAPTMQFDDPLNGGERLLVDGAAFKIRLRYEKPAEFTLNPADPKPWAVKNVTSLTTMDLGPFEDILGIHHGFIAEAGGAPGFVNPEMIYPPALQPVVEILEFLKSILDPGNSFAFEGFKGSYEFKAALNLNIVDPQDDEGYFDLGAMAVKGKLSVGIGNAPAWNGFLNFELGAKVPVIPPIMGKGEVTVGLEGSELTEQKITIEVRWGADFTKSLGPIEVKGEFVFGIQVVTESNGAWQIGLLVGIEAKADIWIAKITIKIELLAAIKVLPDDTKEAIGQAKFAAEIEIAWFLSVEVEYTLEYRGEVSI